MDVFTTSENLDKCFKITRENYERITGKSKIYYRNDGKHYAICPACHNPIKIINLINKNNYEKGKTDGQKMHGRHHDKSIAGIAEYDEDKYRDCPLSKPNCFGLSKRKRNKSAVNQIIEIIELHSDILLKYIRNIVGINFSRDRFQKLLDYFFKEEGYDYEYINKFNLPYSFMYLQREINIYNNYILKNDIGNTISDSITKKSKYFQINDNRIVKKDDSFSIINLLLFNHKINKKEKTIQTVELNIIEECNNKKNIIFKKTIFMNLTDFFVDVSNIN